MSKPAYWRYLYAGFGMRAAAVAMIIAGVAARAAGAGYSALYVSGGLTLVCLAISVYLTAVFARKFRADGYEYGGKPATLSGTA